MGSSNRSLNTSQAVDNNNWNPKRIVRGPRGTKNTNKAAAVEQDEQHICSGQCSQPNQEYTAADRAQRISKSSRLGNLLSAEVEKAGVVTAAGYRAVHQKFLYSEAVEQEMKACAPPLSASAATSCRRSRGGGLEKLRSSRFGNLLARSTDSKSEFLEESSSSDHRHPKNSKQEQGVVAKKLSSGSGKTLSTAASSSNALPGRRSSQVCVLSNSQQEMLQQETQEYQDKERRKLMMDSFAKNLDGEDDDDDDESSSEENVEEVDQHEVHSDELSMDSSLYSQDSFVQTLRGTTKEIVVGERTSWPRDVSSSSSTNRRNRSSSFHASSRRASLDLDDIFDGVDGSQLLLELLAQGEAAQKQPRRPPPQDTATLPRVEPLSDRFKEVHFDPEEEEARLKSVAGRSQGKDLQDEQELRSSDQSFDHSCTDSCGWLPWPERKSESSNVEDMSNDYQCRRRSSIEYHNRRRSSIDRGAVGELLESFVSSPNYSSGGEDDEAFLPWVSIPNNHRASAA